MSYGPAMLKQITGTEIICVVGLFTYVFGLIGAGLPPFLITTTAAIIFLAVTIKLKL